MLVRITFFRTIINTFFLVILNFIIYLERTFKEEQNKIALLNWCKFQFYFPSQ